MSRIRMHSGSGTLFALVKSQTEFYLTNMKETTKKKTNDTGNKKKTGNIGVSTENIFKVVKSSLYASREICIREIVSNAVDATQKLKAVKMAGEDVPEFKDEDLKIWVDVDEESGTLTITDQGIGMTEDEIDKYINNIAYSGITDFLEKYKDNAGSIIGHFGLGFYSAFTIAQKVELVTRSYKKDSPLLKWSCDGTTEFTIETVEESGGRPHDITWGTSVVMYLDDESKEEFKKNKVKEVLQKHSRFVPVTLVFGKKQKWDSSLGKQIDTDEDDVINDIEAIWNRRPSELKDEDYKEFFRKLYPMEQEPAFWIHLNVEEPFRIKGILAFPQTRGRNFTIKRNNLYLYSNNVFVTDDTSGVGLTDKYLGDMMMGIVDIDDSVIGLNVSRSYLQGSSQLKKVVSYINKKIADKLKQLLKDDRKKYEGLFDDIKVVLNYGILSVEDFYDKIKDAYLFRTTGADGKFYTMDEYRTLIEANQKDKNGTLVYLYATDENDQATYIQAAGNKGYSVVKLDVESLDLLAVETIENKLEKSHFVRVDSDTINKLIQKDDETREELGQEDKDLLREVFNGVLDNLRDTGYFNVNTENIGEDELPCTVLQSEWSRRMKDNSRFQSAQMMWFGSGDSYTLNLNSTHPLIKEILEDAHIQTDAETADVQKEIDEKQAALAAVNEELKDVKWEDRTEEQKTRLQDAEKAAQDARNKKSDILKNYGKSKEQIAQLVDIALLGNGLLKGEKLADFLKRSVSFIRK